MQTNSHLEHYLLQSDWDQIFQLGAVQEPDIQKMGEIVAIRMYAFGLVCADVDTWKRASCIVQACTGTRATYDEKRKWMFQMEDIVKRLDNKKSAMAIRIHHKISKIPG